MKGRAKRIKYIVIHCTAGWGNYESMERYWFNTLKWKTGGYHRVVMYDGEIIKAYDFGKTTNGVLGFNDECIHISYQGGVNKKTGKAEDTRSEEQEAGIIHCIIEAFEWLQSEGVDTKNGIIVLGHRDFSEDKNQNGSIDPNERIKECPSFNALEEYKWITYSETQDYTLPKNKK